ncbi:MAG: Fic family protein [Propionibacteriaceae bacterium]|nr:Fic family protein [Propionibacteriaceae bacterium]
MAQIPVSPVEYEDHIWQASDETGVSRSRRVSASGPYRSALPARIADYSAALASEVAADVDEASSALAQFDAYAAQTWGTSAGGTPMSSILLRTESASSSQIEQLTVGARQLALAEIGQETSTNAKTVLGNVRAMEQALTRVNVVNEESIQSIHAVLMAHQPGWEHHGGHYRDQLVWVGSSGVGPRDASYVAPQPERVQAAMADLIRFIARVDLPIVFQIAIAHAQFETIHPFVDGNGRTGRAIVHAMLAVSGTVRHGAIPLSAGLLTDTHGYFSALTAYRSGDAGPIVRRFADACRFAVSSGRTLLDALAFQQANDREKLAGLRRQATAWKILPWLVAHPVVDASSVTTITGLNPVAAQRGLAQLTTSGVLVERTGRRRNRVWQHNPNLRILDDYAARLTRN